MELWRADLHVHTVLSGCAEAEMIPPLIVERARDQGLTMIGVADHNSAGNTGAVIKAAGAGLVVKPALEVETKESVHLICLFDTTEQALSLQDLVYSHLGPAPIGQSDPFSPRLLVDERGLELGREKLPLFAATDLTAEDVVAAVHDRGGIVLAAHVERRAHGLLGVLGFVPPDLELDGMEAGPGGLLAGRIASSDAHRLLEVGSRYTVFESESTSVEHLRQSIAAGSFRSGVAL
ncbi:MAG TPA: PHP-associated domain-containing protein [Armatimonadota bacterium]|nr:PHP-associated domain-containing protein [Armatimonadota bacterium]